MGLLRIFRGSPSRKYVDLLRDSSDKWANWDPPKPIRVGDFGTLDGSSGELTYEGNVYADEEFSAIAKSFPVQLAPGKDELILIKSYHARRVEQQAGVSSAAAAGAELSVQVKFAKGRGALLVMHQVKTEYIPDEFLRHLAGHKKLKGKQLVDKVHSCQGYAQYLSNGEDYTVKLVLDCGSLTAALPVSGALTSAWHAEGAQGYLRHGYNDEAVYAALYGLKEFRRTRGLLRGDLYDATRENGEWMDARLPWKELDEDGEEIFDSDDDEVVEA